MTTTTIAQVLKTNFPKTTMKLSQALKTKNRLAGEIVKLQQILSRENSIRNDNPSKVNRGEIWDKILDTSNQLGRIKAIIAVANVPIYHHIERMAELKSRICYIQSLPKREGEEVMFVGRDQEKLTYTYSAFINQERADELIEKLQKEIDSNQDAIDLYNASNSIVF